MTRVRICLVLFFLLWQVNPVSTQEMTHLFGPEDAPRRLVVRSTTDTDVFAGVVEAFLAGRPGVSVLYEQWGSNDLYALTSKDCRSGRVGADVVISSGVHQMVKLVNDACAAKYQSTLTRALPQALRWRDEVWGDYPGTGGNRL
jgi:iron(III) transport system substrate-binding protein